MINKLQDDLNLIAKKNKDDEWKRDHYRYTYTVWSQRIYNLLNTSITEILPAGVKESTKKEMKVLRDILEEMIEQN